MCLRSVSPHLYVKAGNLNRDRFISAELPRNPVEKNYQCEKSMPHVSSLVLSAISAEVFPVEINYTSTENAFILG